MLKIWNIWKYSLGSFSDDKTAPFDNYVALIRTVIFISYMVTNAFIVSGVIRHWNSDQSWKSGRVVDEGSIFLYNKENPKTPCLIRTK